MKFLFIFFILLNFNSFAKKDTKIEAKIPQKQTQEKQIAVILILDKLYTNRTFYKVEIGQTITIGDLEIKATNCIQNKENEAFMFLNVTQNKDDILNQWVPITKHTTTPIAHKRFDINAILCNFYNQKA